MDKIFFVGFNDSTSNPLRRRYSELCSHYGFTALFPVEKPQTNDQVNSSFRTAHNEMLATYLENIQRVDSADVVVANLNYFQGFCTNETAFVVGYAAAKQKRIVGFVDAAFLSGPHCTTQNYMYYMPDKKNDSSRRPAGQMIAAALSITINGNIEDCLSILAADSHEYDAQ